jgi:hypothetical protein
MFIPFANIITTLKLISRGCTSWGCKKIMGRIQMMMIILPKGSITLRCHTYFLSKNYTMKKRVDRPRLEMLVSFQLVELKYL